MKAKYFKIKSLIFLSILFFSGLNFALASNTTLLADKVIYSPDENIRLFIYLKKPFVENMNAFTYNISYDSNKLQYFGFESLGTLSPVWVESPRASNENIHFSGIFPRGIKGVINPETNSFDDPLLVTLIFKPILIGPATLSLGNSEIYKDDGLGISAIMPVEKVEVTIVPRDPNVSEEIKNIFDYDKNPPLEFTPSIVQDKNINDNHFTIIYNTTDMESGINHYEVKEGTSNWVQSESPYLIENQSLIQEIKVRAYDNAGNFREAVVNGDGMSNFSWIYALSVLALLVIIRIIIMFAKKERNRETKLMDQIIKRSLKK